MSSGGMGRRGRGGVLGAVLAVAFLTAAVAPDDPALLDAARRGNVAAVRSLLSEGADPNAARGDGMSALHLAAEGGSLEVVRVLIDAGARIEATTSIGGYTPLHVASANAHAPVVEALLDAGTDPKVVTTNTGVTPLHLAAKVLGGEAAVRVLLEHGAPPNAREGSLGQTPLMFAASYGRTPAIRELLGRGADHSIGTPVIDVLQQLAVDKAAKERAQEAIAEIRQSTPDGTDRALT